MSKRPHKRHRRLRLEILESRRLLHAGWVEPVDDGGGSGAERVPDFALLDVNATSDTYQQRVSPRDYLGQVSGWYFGHAT